MSSDATRTEAAIQARQASTEQLLHRVRDALRQMRRDRIPVQRPRSRAGPRSPAPSSTRTSKPGSSSPTPSPIVQLPT